MWARGLSPDEHGLSVKLVLPLDQPNAICSLSEPLLAAQVLLCGLRRYMSEQELDLFQLVFRIVTESSARPPEILWRELGNSLPLRVLLDEESANGMICGPTQYLDTASV